MSKPSKRSPKVVWSHWETLGAALLVLLTFCGLVSSGYNWEVGRSVGWLLCAALGAWAVGSWLADRVEIRHQATTYAVISCFGFFAAWSGLYVIALPADWITGFSPVWAETMATLGRVSESPLPARVPLATSPESALIAFHQAVAMLLVLLGVMVLASFRHGVWVLAGIVVGLTALEGLIGLFVSLIGEANRSRGVHLNANHHAASMLMGLPMLGAWVMWRTRDVGDEPWQDDGGSSWRDQQIFLLSLAGAILIGWVLASSRGSLLAAVVALSLWSMLELRDSGGQGKGTPGRYSLPLGIGALALIASLIVMSPIFQARLADVDEVSSRMGYWTATLKGMAEEPVLGVGPGGAYFSINRFLEGQATDVVPAWSHNDYVQVVGEFGIVGSLILLGLICLALRLAWRDALTLKDGARRQRGLWRAMALGLLTVFLHAVTDFHLRSPLMMIQTICLLGLIVVHGQIYLLPRHSSESHRRAGAT